MALTFPIQWIHGAADCRQAAEPLLQMHEADEATFIFRQGKCSTFEAPFMYLLIGRTRALLFDTGAPIESDEVLPIRERVDAILSSRTSGNHELVIAHSHAHGDHAAWNHLFDDRPLTTVVPAKQRDIQAQFGIIRWPEDRGTLDLGGRVLTVLPIPGHELLHIAIHDSRTDALLSGDTLYPGLLVVNDWRSYRASAARLAAFAREREVSFVLGAHIEISRTERLFEIGTTFQPNEHPLQMLRADLDRWSAACETLGDRPARGRHPFGNFIIDVRA
jgi:hydroxyacylglutathione hydrolase